MYPFEERNYMVRNIIWWFRVNVSNDVDGSLFGNFYKGIGVSKQQ